MHVVFAGGGTGGHLYPGIAVADELRRRHPDCSIRFIGSSRSLEAEILKRAHCEAVSIPARPFTKLPWKWPAFMLCSAAAYRQSLAILRALDVNLLVALGGYTAYWPARAARARHVPVVVLEQNAVPGKANRRIARWARTVCVQFPDSAGAFPKGANVVTTGNPVRREIVQLTRDEGRRRFRISDSAKVLLVVGGSQGAAAVNELMVGMARDLAKIDDLFVIHQTGKSNQARVQSAYQVARVTGTVRAFFHDLPSALSAADLVVSRAGATSIAEFCARGLPSILIPFPYAADNHQLANARALESHEAAVVMEQAGLDREAFRKVLVELLQDEPRLAKMGASARRLGAPNALDQVVAVCEDAMTHSPLTTGEKHLAII